MGSDCKTAARNEWDTLDSSVQVIFKKRLTKRLKKPRKESTRLSGMKDCYKIKLRRAGYCLVYQVRDKEELIVSVIAV
ncbi:MAG TPA: type II toxin-antitoxin system mRNA interferase toxin, RelE/StbE family [Desulfobulbus sp.]|nr:type II toxin-antitoxin system mRNA interferase toxin, RelE/StbE family [Desulfobulbus sp.]